eukprot:16452233-Heterocapsa_arctica.AAC.1
MPTAVRRHSWSKYFTQTSRVSSSLHLIFMCMPISACMSASLFWATARNKSSALTFKIAMSP